MSNWTRLTRRPPPSSSSITGPGQSSRRSIPAFQHSSIRFPHHRTSGSTSNSAGLTSSSPFFIVFILLILTLLHHSAIRLFIFVITRVRQLQSYLSRWRPPYAAFIHHRHCTYNAFIHTHTQHHRRSPEAAAYNAHALHYAHRPHTYITRARAQHTHIHRNIHTHTPGSHLSSATNQSSSHLIVNLTRPHRHPYLPPSSPRHPIRPIPPVSIIFSSSGRHHSSSFNHHPITQIRNSRQHTQGTTTTTDGVGFHPLSGRPPARQSSWIPSSINLSSSSSPVPTHRSTHPFFTRYHHPHPSSHPHPSPRRHPHLNHPITYSGVNRSIIIQHCTSPYNARRRQTYAYAYNADRSYACAHIRRRAPTGRTIQQRIAQTQQHKHTSQRKQTHAQHTHTHIRIRGRAGGRVFANRQQHHYTYMGTSFIHFIVWSSPINPGCSVAGSTYSRRPGSTTTTTTALHT